MTDWIWCPHCCLRFPLPKGLSPEGTIMKSERQVQDLHGTTKTGEVAERDDNPQDHLSEIESLLPETYYAGRPLVERFRLLVDEWQAMGALLMEEAADHFAEASKMVSSEGTDLSESARLDVSCDRKDSQPGNMDDQHPDSGCSVEVDSLVARLQHCENRKQEDDTCPHCGDGPQSVGTTNHIECVCDVMTKLAQARTYCDGWQYMADMQVERAEEAEAEVERLKKDLRDMTAMRDGSQRAKDRAERARDHIARQLEKAERKYDDLCRMVRNYQGEVAFEVFDAPDGQPGIRVVNWRERAEKAEAALAMGARMKSE